jgi:Rps23 Pro-64 3,4-dihydroxylase Tpa1-like proline 4-hydroxylase
MTKNYNIKITEENINKCNNNIFGDWFNDFNNNEKMILDTNPFPYIIIPGFINANYYNQIKSSFPSTPDENWWKYENPLEVKYALDNIELMDPIIRNVFYSLSHESVIDKFKNIFNISDLEYDPYCHGAGLHMHPRYGRLNMHLDYEIHPISNKQRRLNIILYLNDYWNPEWNGDTQLWNNTVSECVVKSYPKGNTAIVFVTTEQSWHGVPETILCPHDTYRNTLAFYYVSDLKNDKSIDKKGADENGFRKKAVFVKRPSDPYDERMEKLYAIRPHSLITSEDMKEIWSDWNITL